MIMNSTKLLFNTTMIIGIMVCVCSNNWMMMWSGLEISLISFLPLMISLNSLSSESMMKYFIIQSMSSSILMFGLLFLLMLMKISIFMLITALLLKIGMVPFHNWVLSVVEGISYESILILLTLMKISPLMILSYINTMLWIPIILSLIFGATLGINQNSMRKIMAYSSIYNLGFICSCINDMALWLIYMLVYTFMLMCIILMILKMNISYLNQIMINEFNLKTKICFWLMMLSFGGVPPMLGFLGKLMLFEVMIKNNQMLILFIMLTSSLVVMFYYIRCTYMSITISSILMKWNLFSLSYSLIIVTMINFLILSFFIFMKSLF
uniref:NADH dehydrogenase subunit 2 n=1 Tax=Atkinsoniella xanthoabdomena TaxID=2930063 RepID=UPI0020016E24|nr:NADH dehydrogenase subunit 2 [Atkinsoniella xanthoabdomena]UNZ12665.1 NADH dehydrogenase subunit 2 [Atkinsoniella xanthoabdomena]